MERFTKLFGSPIVFVYHCFDRVVIRGYLSGLSRPEQVVYFFRQVLGFFHRGRAIDGFQIVRHPLALLPVHVIWTCPHF